MIADFRKDLVLASHTADGEIGFGNLVAQFAVAGKGIHYIAFSSAVDILQGVRWSPKIRQVVK